MKDLHDYPVGNFEKQKHGGFLIKTLDGVSLGEIIRVSGNLFKVCDAQKKPLGTLRQERIRRKERRRGLFILLFALIFGPVSVAFAVVLLTQIILVLFLGAAFTFFGMFLLAYLHYKAKFGRPKWLIKNPSGRLLAEAGDFTLGRHIDIVEPDGRVVSHIEKKRGLTAFRDRCIVDISDRDIDPFLILCHTVISVSRAKGHRESGLGPFG